MSHRKDGAEQWAIGLLKQIVDCSNRDDDALPGTAVKHVKAALKVLRKHQKNNHRYTREAGQTDRPVLFSGTSKAAISAYCL